MFLTAWFALHELAHPRRGNHVLVHSPRAAWAARWCPLADAARAHQATKSGQTVGKLVLVPPGVS